MSLEDSNVKPEALNKESPYHPKYRNIQRNTKKVIPDSESLKDTYERVFKYFKNEIEEKLRNKNVLISAHGNSLRALCKNLFNLNNNQISDLEIPKVTL